MAVKDLTFSEKVNLESLLICQIRKLKKMAGKSAYGEDLQKIFHKDAIMYESILEKLSLRDRLF